MNSGKITAGLTAAVEWNCVRNAVLSFLEEDRSYAGRMTVQEKMSACFRTFIAETSDFRIVIIETGPGQIQAAAGVQILIDRYSPDFIVNTGSCGGLDADIKPGDICIADKVFHYDYDLSQGGMGEKGEYPGLQGKYLRGSRKLSEVIMENMKETVPEIFYASCASGDRIIADDESRRKTGKETGCSICDMEAAANVLVSIRNRVPWTSVKIVTDSTGDIIGEEFERIVADAMPKVAEGVVKTCQVCCENRR